MSDTFVSVTWVADELVTSTKLNQAMANDANFHNGTGLGDGIIVTRHLGSSANLEIPANQVSNPCKFSAYKSGSNQTIGNTTTKILFQSENYDTGSNWNAGTSTFTAPYAGTYRFDCSIQVTAAASLAAVYMRIMKNGVTYKETGSGASAAANSGASIGEDVPLALSDTVEFYAFGNVSFTSVLGSEYTHATGRLLSKN